MRLNACSSANLRVGLNFGKWPNEYPVTQLATIQVRGLDDVYADANGDIADGAV